MVDAARLRGHLFRGLWRRDAAAGRRSDGPGELVRPHPGNHRARPVHGHLRDGHDGECARRSTVAAPHPRSGLHRADRGLSVLGPAVRFVPPDSGRWRAIARVPAQAGAAGSALVAKLPSRSTEPARGSPHDHCGRPVRQHLHPGALWAIASARPTVPDRPAEPEDGHPTVHRAHVERRMRARSGVCQAQWCRPRAARAASARGAHGRRARHDSRAERCSMGGDRGQCAPRDACGLLLRVPACVRERRGGCGQCVRRRGRRAVERVGLRAAAHRRAHRREPAPLHGQDAAPAGRARHRHRGRSVRRAVRPVCRRGAIAARAVLSGGDFRRAGR